MPTNVTNILNAKALEKQLKLYDARLQSLQEEVDELARLKDACMLLLGTANLAAPSATTGAPAEAAAGASATGPAPAKGPAKKVKPALIARIQEILGEQEGFGQGMTAESIVERLKDEPAFNDEKDVADAVQTALKKNPQAFFSREDGRWCSLAASPGGDDNVGEAANSVPA